MIGRHHWSNCAPPAVLFKISAIAALPWLALLLFPSTTAAWIALLVTLFLVYVEIIKKMTVVAWFRGVGVFLIGRIKPTRNIIKEIKGQ